MSSFPKRGCLLTINMETHMGQSKALQIFDNTVNITIFNGKPVLSVRWCVFVLVCMCMCVCVTHHVNGVDVGELRQQLTTAEGELSVGLEEQLPGETDAHTHTLQRERERTEKERVLEMMDVGDRPKQLKVGMGRDREMEEGEEERGREMKERVR